MRSFGAKAEKNKLCKSSQKIFGAIAFECFVRRQFYIVFLSFWAGKDGDEVKVIASSEALVLRPTTEKEQKSLIHSWNTRKLFSC